jgi:integrase
VAWTEEEVALLMKEVSRSNHAEIIPSGIGTGRGSKEIVARMVATREWKIRRCLLPLINLMVRYAPRPVEVTRLTVAHWHSRTASLHMPGTITKNGHPRTFVMDADTARWLDAAASTRDPWDLAPDAVHTRRPGTEPLFRNRFSMGWRHDSLKQAIAIQIQKAGIRGSPYSLRHTACTRLCRMANGDLAVVQSITGHRTLSELQKYLHITADRQRLIADAYTSGVVAEPPTSGGPPQVEPLSKPG